MIQKIQAVSVFKKKTVIPWNAISGLFIFTDAKGQKAKAHKHLVGFNELLHMMEAKTNWEIKNLNLPFKHIKR